MSEPERILKLQKAFSVILEVVGEMGENVDRQGLLSTPQRVAMSYGELFEGYQIELNDIITVFDDVKCDEMVILKDIEFFSVCEHHLLPFHGKAHIAYIPKPDGKVIGVSKLARILDMYARRLQIQERICSQVTEALMSKLDPLGAACIIDAKHLCVMMRGVEKQHSSMVSSSMLGVFRDKPEVRAELLSLIGK